MHLFVEFTEMLVPFGDESFSVLFACFSQIIRNFATCLFLKRCEYDYKKTSDHRPPDCDDCRCAGSGRVDKVRRLRDMGDTYHQGKRYHRRQYETSGGGWPQYEVHGQRLYQHGRLPLGHEQHLCPRERHIENQQQRLQGCAQRRVVREAPHPRGGREGARSGEYPCIGRRLAVPRHDGGAYHQQQQPDALSERGRSFQASPACPEIRL